MLTRVRSATRAPTVLAVAVAALLASTLAASAAPPPDINAEATYIVTLKQSVSSPSATATQHATRFGAQVKGVYSHALKGYTARLTASEATTLRGDASVASVELDRMLSISQVPPPTGIR